MSSLHPEIQRRQGNTAKVLALLRANPRVWLKAEHFMDLAGALAWRTRISDARKIIEAEGGKLENRQTYVRKGDGEQEMICVISEYRYLPYQPLGRSADMPSVQPSLL